MLKQDTSEALRDCEGILIPSGIKITIKKGSLIMVTQALGNSYTVYVNGNLARVKGTDGDAIGMVIVEHEDVNKLDGSVEDKVWEILKTCFDPEIPVNIVDLGLVYECNTTEDNGEFNVEVIMTLTAPGCGMGPVLVADIEDKIKSIVGVKSLNVELVFDPPWDRSMMSDVAKLQLGMM